MLTCALNLVRPLLGDSTSAKITQSNTIKHTPIPLCVTNRFTASDGQHGASVLGRRLHAPFINWTMPTFAYLNYYHKATKQVLFAVLYHIHYSLLADVVVLLVGQQSCDSQVAGSSPGRTPVYNNLPWASYLHLWASVTKQYSLASSSDALWLGRQPQAWWNQV